MIDNIKYLDSDIDKANFLHNLLVERATGGTPPDVLYSNLRDYFLSLESTKHLVPSWIRVNRNLDQFWNFIKNKFPSYAQRREFIKEELSLLLDSIEFKETLPAEKSISNALKKFDEEGINHAWSKALERKSLDPEGAITIARSILESVCKHILDSKGVEYTINTELSMLYKLTAKELNMSKDQHSEPIFQQILGGCSGIINGLGTLRNKLGDAHGKGKGNIKPAERHAELAVNLSGSMALFLIETFNANKK